MKLKRFTYLLCVFFILIIAIEICLRVLGITPHKAMVVFPVQNANKIFEIKDSLGVLLKKGSITEIKDNYSYTLTHTKFQTRKTYKADNINLINIAFFGCSYTYGFGINDSYTYPYIVDSINPAINALNYSAPGDGQIQSYLRIIELLNTKTAKDLSIVIINYLDFHNDRNCLSNEYKLALSDGYELLKTKNPVLYKNNSKKHIPFIYSDNNQFKINYTTYENLNDFEIPFIRHSALLNKINFIKNKYFMNENKLDITKYLIGEINRKCSNANIKLVVSYMQNSSLTLDILNYCKNENIKTADLTFDFNNKLNFNLPYDPYHPGKIANFNIAKKLNLELHNLFNIVIN